MKAMTKYVMTLTLVLMTSLGVNAVNYPTYKPTYRQSAYRQTVSSPAQTQVGMAGGSIQRTATPAYTGYQSNISAPGSGMPAPAAPRFAGGPRRTPTGPGNEEGDMKQDSDGWWYWDGEEWIFADNTHSPGDGWYWDGFEWKQSQDQADPNTPIGSVWVLMLFALGYGAVVARRKRVC